MTVPPSPKSWEDRADGFIFRAATLGEQNLGQQIRELQDEHIAFISQTRAEAVREVLTWLRYFESAQEHEDDCQSGTCGCDYWSRFNAIQSAREFLESKYKE